MYFLTHIGTADLVDVGYRFYNVDGTANGSRITAGVIDEGDGWYSADATIPVTGSPASIRWDSTGTPAANARESLFRLISSGTGPGQLNFASGAITNVTNLTNAPTSGDLTATMKASVNAEADTALSDYDAPTFTELDARTDAIDAALAVIDSLIDAIKAKTDQLAFTIANQVDANTQSINDVTITGNGQSGTEFGI
jgi:hypothetical protein